MLLTSLKNIILAPLMRDHPDVLVESHVQLIKCELASPIRVGLRSYANFCTIVPTEIGRFCSIGRRCSIGAAAHDLNGLSTHSYGADADFQPTTKTCIGHDVWIGDGAIILSGVTVGTGAVIGAGAVVTRDVAPYAVLVGAPARQIRWRVDESLIEPLLSSNWWSFGDSALAITRGKPAEQALRMLEGSDLTQVEPHYHTFRSLPLRLQ